MFLHWAVLASLLLLLPSTAKFEKDIGDYEDASCHPTQQRICNTAVCTYYCFRLWFHKWINPVDSRLMITAAVLMRVDNDGRIAERTINNKTAFWMYKDTRPRFGTYGGYIIRLSLLGGEDEAKGRLAGMTDLILYMGSDFADAYDEPITYAYNPNYLQLKNAGRIANGLHESSVFSVESVGIGDSKTELIFKNAQPGGPSSYISSPGIYRLNIATGRLTELNYDPNLAGCNYLM